MEFILPIVSYLIGAIPFGLVIGKFAGIDVRQHGSKNIGATNVSRTLGKKLGLVTLVLDVMKGLLPMAAASYILADHPFANYFVCASGIAAVIGHMFPVYLGFSGGKGVATALGVFLFLSPLAIVISVFVFMGIVAFSGFVSAGSLAASGLFPLWLYFLDADGIVIFSAGVIAFLIWLKHYENIGRLIRGEEKGWKKK